ncbi:MAG TPA: helix-hairpin-helix domain-containing protein [Chlorobaculum parvum]|uniref:Helix-hairpin-helix domain-containing protein n=1 Tax=Chlorobaculum parvum TaxID=274539 RepID=A0A7C5HEF2_9CHLB|nr:helix-hairpin-helix domain-containing protein [Chlorobaculum parvum]
MFHTYSTLRLLAPAVVFFAFFFSPLPSLADDSIQNLLDRSEPESNAEELFSVLEDLRGQRIPINLASEEQLLGLPLLNAADAARIIDWRRQHGPIKLAAELEKVIGKKSAKRLSSFFSFELPAKQEEKKISQPIHGSLISRVYWESPPRAGIENGKYAGENRHLYNQLQASTPQYGFTVLQDSDVGEADFDDFISLGAYARQLGIVSQVVIGNYRLSFGQGLLFGQGRYFSKGTDAIDGVLLSSRPLRPYTSAAEYGFLQGAAVTLSPRDFEMTAFTSSNKVDASIKEGVVTSISTSGYHRMASERLKKDNLTERVSGLNLRYRYRSDELDAVVGATWADYRYGLPLDQLNGGRGGWLASIEASAVYQDVQLFGEAAFSDTPGAVSWLAGAQAELAKDVTGVVSMREYAVDYVSPFAGAFAERGDDASNEEGFYTGLSADVLDNLNLAASYDLFRFPELDPDRYALPSSGHEARLYATWKPIRSITLEGLYQHQEKEETKTQTGPDTYRDYVMPVPKTTNRVQLSLKARCSSSLILKSRVAFKSVESSFVSGLETEQGRLFYQQINWKRGLFTLKTRLAFFDTDSYDAALYAYEDDLPLVYTLSTYYGQGKAWFILLDYKPVKNFRLTAKYETTWHDDRDAYSSGNDLRDTSSPSSFELGAMLRF